MKITVVIPSKVTKSLLLLEGVDYLNKIHKPFRATSLFINPKSTLSEKDKERRIVQESNEIFQKTEGFMRIALTERGTCFSSLSFADFLEKCLSRAPKIAFIIGGAFGLSQDLINRCDMTLSLSSMTLPHRMAFLVLCEQLYRASEIIEKTLYHK